MTAKYDHKYLDGLRIKPHRKKPNYFKTVLLLGLGVVVLLFIILVVAVDAGSAIDKFFSDKPVRQLYLTLSLIGVGALVYIIWKVNKWR